MIEVIQWPPIQHGIYHLHGREFKWREDEPFVSRMLDGSVDTDLSRQTEGFVNRVQRFGIQNNLPPHEWDEQTIYYSLLQRIPLELRQKFFRESAFVSPSPVMSNPSPHHAPIPAGLPEAAGLRAAAANDPDLPLVLAGFNSEKWLSVLRKWMAADPATRKTKTVAGPPFWYALHALALNPPPKINPIRFVGEWVSLFPCRKCRIGARIYMARHPVPKDWPSLKQWASDIHDYVTSKK